MKNLVIILLAIANVCLLVLGHRCQKADKRLREAQDRHLVGITVNRIFHEQLKGAWPKVYGSTADEVAKFDAEIIAASKQGITDWPQYSATH